MVVPILIDRDSFSMMRVVHDLPTNQSTDRLGLTEGR